MTKETLAFVTEKTKELTAAHSCCAELKEAANNWLAAAGTDKEAEATKAYVAELEADTQAYLSKRHRQQNKEILIRHSPELVFFVLQRNRRYRIRLNWTN